MAMPTIKPNVSERVIQCNREYARVEKVRSILELDLPNVPMCQCACVPMCCPNLHEDMCDSPKI